MTTVTHNNHTIIDGVLQLDDLQVSGSLNLRGCTALTALPDGLSVGGWLDLTGCTALTALPDGLSVDGRLSLYGCTALTALPDGLSVDGRLDLYGCTALTALPDGLSVSEWLDLTGCTALTALPDGLSVGRWICIDKLSLSKDKAILRETTVPHNIRTAVVGRRLGELIDHWALSWNGMRDQVIESIEENGDGDLTIRLANKSSNAMSSREIDCIIAGADHGDQTAHSYL